MLQTILAYLKIYYSSIWYVYVFFFFNKQEQKTPQSTTQGARENQNVNAILLAKDRGIPCSVLLNTTVYTVQELKDLEFSNSCLNVTENIFQRLFCKTENLLEEKQNGMKESYHRNCQRLSLHMWALVQDKLE